MKKMYVISAAIAVILGFAQHNGFGSASAPDASLPALQRDLSMLAAQGQPPAAMVTQIRIEEYRYTPEQLKEIMQILRSKVSFGGKEFPYTELLGVDEKEVEEWYVRREISEAQQNPGPDGEILALPEQKRFVAKTADGRIVGFAHVLPTDYEYNEKTHISTVKLKSWLLRWLAVHPDYIKMGIGKKLFDHIAEWAQKFARSQGKVAESLSIECDQFNTPACKAYRKWTNNECKDFAADDPEDNYTTCTKYFVPKAQAAR